MVLNEDHALTEKVIGLAMRVHRALGPGFLESVYLNALAYELRKADLEIEVGQRIKVRYDNVIVGDFVADLVVAKAFDDTQDMVTSGNTSGSVAAYKSLNTAIDVVKGLLAASGAAML